MIAVAGEALIDLTPVKFGGETAYLPRAGGSPFNVAVGLGRLGVPVTFVGRLSTDGFGILLRRHLEASDVDLSGTAEGSEPTTLAVVHIVDDEPSYGFYAESTADRMMLPEHLPELREEQAVHLGSISLVLEPLATTMQTLMRREHGRRVLTLDPNVRPSLIGDRARYLRRLTEWIGLVDVVKLSSADLDWLYPGVDYREIAVQWLRTGPALVLVTKGGSGSAAYGRAAHAEVPGQRITLADTVGAGDSFMSAALGHLHENDLLHRDRLAALNESQLGALLRSATAVSALTCTRVGADPPWRRELTDWPASQ